MTHLVMFIDKINHNKIQFKENPTCYKVYYHYPNTIKNIGITFQCDNIQFIKMDYVKYGIINISPKLIKVLRKLDKYIKSKLEDYSGILTQYNEEYCIMFNENDIVKQVLREKPKTLCLNFKYITKGYYNNPVIHIIR